MEAFGTSRPTREPRRAPTRRCHGTNFGMTWATSAKLLAVMWGSSGPMTPSTNLTAKDNQPGSLIIAASAADRSLGSCSDSANDRRTSAIVHRPSQVPEIRSLSRARCFGHVVYSPRNPFNSSNSVFPSLRCTDCRFVVQFIISGRKDVVNQSSFVAPPVESDLLHEEFEAALGVVSSRLEDHYPLRIGDDVRETGTSRPEWSPIDRDLVVGQFAQATENDVDDAIAVAKQYETSWRSISWEERVHLIRRVADILEAGAAEIAAILVLETGKNRMEAFGEVGEAIGFLRGNCDQLEESSGFAVSMPGASNGSTHTDVLHPYGVWGIISPFNFPLALCANPISAALLGGNCVVFKPSHRGVLTGIRVQEIYLEAGIPPEALQVIPGSGEVVGPRITNHADVMGITFTGSRAVGLSICQSRVGAGGPVICELGGKNPSIVTATADLEKAAEGVMNGAFGFSGQKCSANSRSYVHSSVYEDFRDLLQQKTDQIVTGDPRERDVYMGPVINGEAAATYERAIEETLARGRVITGGERLSGGLFDRGYYLRPTVVEAANTSWLWEKELFTPIVALNRFDDFEEGIRRANDTEFGLTAGLFSEDENEIDRFLNEIEAGVVYVNRRESSTTGAWPGLQTFGGWKGSGTSGKNAGGPFYVSQYMREQSRSVVTE